MCKVNKAESEHFATIRFRESSVFQYRITPNGELELRVLSAPFPASALEDLTDGLTGVNREACKLALVEALQTATFNQILSQHKIPE